MQSCSREHPDARVCVAVKTVAFPAPNVAIEDGVSQVTAQHAGPAQITRYTAVHVKVDGKWPLASVRETDVDLPSNFAKIESLGWLVGTWTANRDGKSVRTTVRWIANNSFLEREYSVATDGIVSSNGRQIIGWDPKTETVRSWSFDASGGYGTGVWSRTPDGWQIEQNGVMADGTPTSSRDTLVRIPGEDNVLGFRSTARTAGDEPPAGRGGSRARSRGGKELKGKAGQIIRETTMNKFILASTVLVLSLAAVSQPTDGLARGFGGGGFRGGGFSGGGYHGASFGGGGFDRGSYGGASFDRGSYGGANFDRGSYGGAGFNRTTFSGDSFDRGATEGGFRAGGYGGDVSRSQLGGFLGLPTDGGMHAAASASAGVYHAPGGADVAHVSAGERGVAAGPNGAVAGGRYAGATAIKGPGGNTYVHATAARGAAGFGYGTHAIGRPLIGMPQAVAGRRAGLTAAAFGATAGGARALGLVSGRLRGR